MNFKVRCLAALMWATIGYANAGFVDNTTDQVSSTPTEPERTVTSAHGADVTGACIDHLRERGFVFYDQKHLDEYNKELVKAEIESTPPKVKTEFVVVEKCPLPAKPKKAVKGSKKKASKPKVESTCAK